MTDIRMYADGSGLLCEVVHSLLELFKKAAAEDRIPELTDIAPVERSEFR